MNATRGVGCVICQDTKKCTPLKLTCGHVYGKSCIKKWRARSGQQNCLLCKKQLTDDDVKQINRIPLFERAVNILIRAVPKFGGNALDYFHTVGLSIALSVILKGSYTPLIKTLAAESIAALFPATTIGTLVAAADVPALYGTAAGGAVGAGTVAVFEYARAVAYPFPSYSTVPTSYASACIWGGVMGFLATAIAYCKKY